MPHDEEPRNATVWAQVLRVTAGVLLLVALAVIARLLHSTLDANQGASAPQIIQAYTEALFQAVIAIGIAIAVYVFSRALSA